MLFAYKVLLLLIFVYMCVLLELSLVIFLFEPFLCNYGVMRVVLRYILWVYWYWF